MNRRSATITPPPTGGVLMGGGSRRMGRPAGELKSTVRLKQTIGSSVLI